MEPPPSPPSTPKRRELTRDQRIQVTTLRSIGWQYQAIVDWLRKETGHRHTYRQVQWAVTHGVTPQKAGRCGAKPLLDAAARRSIIEFITSSKERRQMPYKKVIEEMGLKVSEETLRQALQKEGYRRYPARLKATTEGPHSVPSCSPSYPQQKGTVAVAIDGPPSGLCCSPSHPHIVSTAAPTTDGLPPGHSGSPSYHHQISTTGATTDNPPSVPTYGPIFHHHYLPAMAAATNSNNAESPPTGLTRLTQLSNPSNEVEVQVATSTSNTLSDPKPVQPLPNAAGEKES